MAGIQKILSTLRRKEQGRGVEEKRRGGGGRKEKGAMVKWGVRAGLLEQEQPRRNLATIWELEDLGWGRNPQMIFATNTIVFFPQFSVSPQFESTVLLLRQCLRTLSSSDRSLPAAETKVAVLWVSMMSCCGQETFLCCFRSLQSYGGNNFLIFHIQCFHYWLKIPPAHRGTRVVACSDNELRVPKQTCAEQRKDYTGTLHRNVATG